jgi:ribose 5-phosphate isomerase B
MSGGKIKNMRIIVGTDPFALNLKTAIVERLQELGHEVIYQDGESGRDYWVSACNACKKIQSGHAERAILLCGTGMGMAIVANKFSGIRASCVESIFAAKMSRTFNNSNVLTMGAMIVSETMAVNAVDAWLETEFTQGWEKFEDFLYKAADSIVALDKVLIS